MIQNAKINNTTWNVNWFERVTIGKRTAERDRGLSSTTGLRRCLRHHRAKYQTVRPSYRTWSFLATTLSWQFTNHNASGLFGGAGRDYNLLILKPESIHFWQGRPDPGMWISWSLKHSAQCLMGWTISSRDVQMSPIPFGRCMSVADLLRLRPNSIHFWITVLRFRTVNIVESTSLSTLFHGFSDIKLRLSNKSNTSCWNMHNFGFFDHFLNGMSKSANLSAVQLQEIILSEQNSPQRFWLLFVRLNFSSGLFLFGPKIETPRKVKWKL
jgi:hypothetical protein